MEIYEVNSREARKSVIMQCGDDLRFADNLLKEYKNNRFFVYSNNDLINGYIIADSSGKILFDRVVPFAEKFGADKPAKDYIERESGENRS